MNFNRTIPTEFKRDHTRTIKWPVRKIILLGICLLSLLALQTRAQVQANSAPPGGSPGDSLTARAIGPASLAVNIISTPVMGTLPTSSMNYIVTSTLRTGVSAISGPAQLAAMKIGDVNQSIQYFDGLGRPLQTVEVKGSASRNDIIQPFAYDQFGREATKYLPYAQTTGVNDGSYKTNALSGGQNQFYTVPPDGVKATNSPFSQTIFEPSPLDRVLEQGAPGADWQPVANSTSGHTQKTVYTSNNAVAITDTASTMLAALYTVTINANQSRTLGRNGNYGAGQLYVTVSKDENWKSGRGGTTEEYKDKAGHVVLKRTFNYSGGILQILSTYYVYDNIGNLAFVLPPGTNPDAVGIPPYTGSLGYSYRYDERNRLTQKKVPGKGWEFTVYNKLDQPVLTQDSLQRQANQWTATKYDALGRVIVTGLWNAGSIIPLATLQANIYARPQQWDDRDQTNTITTYPTGYILSTYPQLSKTLSINYYDDYNIPKLPNNYKVTNGVSTMTKGLLTASKIVVLNTIGNPTPDMLWVVNYYDDNGRNIRSYKQHYLGAVADTANVDVVVNTYNFNDQVTISNRKHFTNASISIPRLTIINQYGYDHMGRKLTTREQIQNAGQLADVNPILSKVEYNELGQVWKKHLHSTDSVTFKQDITYGYNERGWLLTSSAPLFAELLYYNGNTSNKQYNGNISYQLWGTASGLTNNYTYGYDQLNRLISGNATTGNNENGITYDPMGNIATLKRYAANAQIDNLTYAYTAGTNTLQSVTDANPSNTGQKSGAATYTYDGNGNLTADNSKGITAISYNLLNLPQTLTGKNTTYTYDAEGQKLSRLIGTAKTDYISGIQYDGTAASSTITFIQTEEGRALPNGVAAYNYEYTLTDHLGNSRVNFDTGTGTGVARQVQVDDYYPFGMEINTNVASPKNKYLYNKKELQENLGLYDYGARFYDPVIARWTSVDKLAEHPDQINLSPYAYVGNDPISKDDPDGNCPNCLIGAAIGAVFGAAVEAGTQLYHSGHITSWRAVGGSAAQGAITGAVAGATGGASLLVSAGANAGANIVGGAVNRAIQGQGTKLKDVAIDGAIGGGAAVMAKVGGSLVKKGLDKLSNQAKGALGEAVSKLKFGARGYISDGEAVVPTGRATPTGRVQVAKYDHNMTNIFTGENITVESKFNTSGLTNNQATALKNVKTPFVLDVTTSQQLGNATQRVMTGGATTVGNQVKRN